MKREIKINDNYTITVSYCDEFDEWQYYDKWFIKEEENVFNLYECFWTGDECLYGSYNSFEEAVYSAVKNLT